METLNQLITNFKSPWYSESEWSEELPSLKKLAITDPHKLTPDFLQKTFRTLRLIDKNVSLIPRKCSILVFSRFFDGKRSKNKLRKIVGDNEVKQLAQSLGNPTSDLRV